MTTTDWILDIVLMLMVVRQIRRAEINWHFVLIPLAIVGYVAFKYLDAFPTSGNALVLTLGALVLGSGLGLAGGMLTKVFAESGKPYAHAGFAAATLWIVSMSARLGFIVWITHQPGQSELVRFSVDHGITDPSAWQTALVLFALSEAIVRIGMIAVRGRLAVHHSAETSTPRELAHA